MAKFYNRAKVNTATTSTGTVTLGAAVSAAYCTFAEAGVTDADVVPYVIEDGNDFEAGIGTYTAAGTTLSRTTVRLSKIGGTAGTSKINLSGSAIVFLSPGKEDLLSITETQTANTIYAGPTSGGAAVPAFRAAVAADMPATIGFAAHKNGSNQTGVVSITYTQITLGTEVYDVGGHFATNGWTPPAGKVSLSAICEVGGTITAGSVFALAIYKDGVLFAQQLAASMTDSAGGGISIDDVATGSNLYELYVYMTTSSGTGTISGNTHSTRFSGHWIGP